MHGFIRLLQRSWLLAALALVGPACKQVGPANLVPDAPPEDEGAVVDAFVPFFPPQACVGLKPAADKWLQPADPTSEEFVVEVANDVSSADAIGGPSPEPSSDAESVMEDASPEVQSPSPNPPVPALPPDAAGGEVGQYAQAEADAGTSCEDAPATCVGAPMPLWALLDFQPRSCGYQATYGLDTYQGHVTVVTLLAAW